MKRLTLEEIGEMAGVSRATVSRVINNHPNIRPEVRERVNQSHINLSGSARWTPTKMTYLLEAKY